MPVIANVITLDAIVTAISIFVAIIIGVLAIHVDRKHSMRAHTFDVLLSRFTGGIIAAALHKVTDQIDSGE